MQSNLRIELAGADNASSPEIGSLPVRCVLALGGGVDSTALALIDADRSRAAQVLGVSLDELNAAFAPCDAWVFSDPGAENKATYANIVSLGQLARRRGIECATVRKGEIKGTGKQETITEWLLRLGIVPLMPGGGHVCSLKFKGEVLQAWAAGLYPGAIIRWLVGIEANEDKRCHRFTQKAGNTEENTHQFDHPLRTLGLTREDCVALIERMGWPTVAKSSCQFCPFMRPEEIRELLFHDPEGFALAEQIEARFQQTSPVRYRAWLDAGQPLNSAGRAPRGMWRKDSWTEGARLFACTVDGKRLSVPEWRDYLGAKGPDVPEQKETVLVA